MQSLFASASRAPSKQAAINPAKRREQASIMLSDATAVRIDIIVQEEKMMNPTKNNRICGTRATAGFAMAAQLSCVVTSRGIALR